MVLVQWLAEPGISDVTAVTSHHLRACMVATQERPAGSVNPRRPPAADGHKTTPATQQTYGKGIKVFFRWLVDEEIIQKNTALRLNKPIEAKSVGVTFSHDHLNALFGACDLSTSLGFRDYVLMLVLLDTRIRVSELCRLTLNDLREGYLKVFGKGGKEREVGISSTTTTFLWKYVHLHRAQADDTVRTLFTNIAGRPLRPHDQTSLLVQ